MEKKLKILIVDGDVSEAEILESRLQTDFEVAGTAFDGVRAVEKNYQGSWNSGTYQGVSIYKRRDYYGN